MLVPGGSWTPKFSHMPRTTGSWTTSRSWSCGTWWKCKSFQRGSCSCIWWHGMVFMVLTGVLIYVDVFWFWGEIFDWDLHRFATELLNWKVFWEILADFCLLRNHGNLDDGPPSFMLMFFDFGERFLIEICIDLQQSHWIEKSSERYWMIFVCWGTAETWMTGCPQNQFLSYPEENRILDNQPQPNLWNLMEMHKLPLGVL